MHAREAATLPERTRHLAFGDVAAAWGVLHQLGVAGIIDDAAGARPAGLPLSPGTYLALAALNRVVAPCSKLGFARWWRHRRGPVHQDPGLGAGSPPVLGRDARRHPEQLEEISRASRCGSSRSPGWTARRWRWT